jgi:hypothetical protein
MAVIVEGGLTLEEQLDGVEMRLHELLEEGVGDRLVGGRINHRVSSLWDSQPRAVRELLLHPVPQSKPVTRGRPPSTTAEEVSAVALDLFARDGFEETTTDDVAAAIGVGRRTVFP